MAATFGQEKGCEITMDTTDEANTDALDLTSPDASLRGLLYLPVSDCAMAASMRILHNAITRQDVNALAMLLLTRSAQRDFAALLVLDQDAHALNNAAEQ